MMITLDTVSSGIKRKYQGVSSAINRYQAGSWSRIK